MPILQIHFSDEESRLINIYQAFYSLSSKTDAVRCIITECGIIEQVRAFNKKIQEFGIMDSDIDIERPKRQKEVENGKVGL